MRSFTPSVTANPRALVASFGVVVWIAVAAAVLPGGVPRDGRALLLLVPFGLAAAVCLRRSEAPRVLRDAALATGVVAAAFVTAPNIVGHPQVALALPAAFVVTAAVVRWPVPCAGALFLLSSSYGTVGSLTPLPPDRAMDLLIAGLGLALLWHFVSEQRSRRLVPAPGLVLLGAYILITLLEVEGARTRQLGFLAFHTTVFNMTVALAVAYAPWNERTRRALVHVVLACAVAVSAYAVFRYAIGPAPAERDAVRSAVGNSGYGRSGQIPLFGSFLSPKELGAWCAIVTPFAFAFALGDTGRTRLLAVTVCLLAPVAIFGSNARLALLAVICGVVVTLAAFTVSRARGGLRLGTSLAAVGLILAIGVGGFAVVHGGDNEELARYQGILHPNRVQSVQERRATWAVALREIPRKPLGGGLGSSGPVAFTNAQYALTVPPFLDNSYLQIALDQGAVVLVFVLALIALLGGLLRRGAGAVSGEGAWPGIGAAGALAAFAVLMYGGTFANGPLTVAIWMLVGLGIGSAARASRVQTPARAERSSGASAVTP